MKAKWLTFVTVSHKLALQSIDLRGSPRSFVVTIFKRLASAIMTMDFFNFWKLVQILLLFAWLFVDLGIYWTAKQATRNDLTIDDRKRFLERTISMNMGSHSALILLLAVGFQLSDMAGFAVMSLSSLIFIWTSAAAWLSLVWLVYLNRYEPNIEVWLKFDFVVRIIVIGTIGSNGFVSFFTQYPVKTFWLAMVFVLYACVVTLSISWRATIMAWQQGFPLIEQAETRSQGNAIIKSAHVKGERYSLMMWGLIIAIILLEVIQPI